MLTIPFNPDYKPLTWKGAQTPTIRTALVTCSNGHVSSLTDHTIADDGSVSPSLVCPYKNCNFHEFVRLDGWKGGEE